MPRYIQESCHEYSAAERVRADALTIQGLFEACFHIKSYQPFNLAHTHTHALDTGLNALPSKNIVGLTPFVCKDDCTRATCAADGADHKASSQGGGILIS